jgi:hypothetical protein
MSLYNKIIFSILIVFFITGCSRYNLQSSTLPQEVSISKENPDKALKQACISAAICGIELEIKRHQDWIGQRKEENEDYSEIQKRLSRLKGDLEKFSNIELEDYEIPRRLQLKAWIRSPASENSILYMESMTRSGPWHHICGIKGDDYTVIQPNKEYLMTVYLVYPRYYWHMESYYIYIGEYK